MATETIPFNAVKYLTTPEAQAVFIRDALETGDEEYISHALKIVRASGAGMMLEALLPSEVSELRSAITRQRQIAIEPASAVLAAETAAQGGEPIEHSPIF